MYNRLTDQVKNLFLEVKEKSRSGKAIKNVFWGLIIKGSTILINLAFVPIAIELIGKANFGVWLVIISMVNWFNFFDVGLGNGLRNKYAQSIAKGDIEKAKGYVSTTFFSLIIIIIPVIILSLGAVNFMSLESVFNTSDVPIAELRMMVWIVILFFGFRFVFQISQVLLIGDQKNALASLIDLIGLFLTLIIMYIALYSGKRDSLSLTLFAFLFLLPQGISLIAAYFILFRGAYRAYIPNIKYFKKAYLKDLTKLSLKFFIIQTSAIVIFTSTNFILTQIAGPESVTQYNIIFKYFNVVFLIANIVSIPFWTAFTEAYSKQDFIWIKKTINILLSIMGILSVFLIVFFLLAEVIINIWIGKEHHIFDHKLAILIFINVLISMWVLPFSMFVNGSGKINLPYKIALMQMIGFIFLAIILGKYYSVYGVVISIGLVNLISLLVLPRIYYNHIRK